MRAFAACLLLIASPAAAASPSGAQIFADNCAMCHQPNGEGAIGLAPPLAGTLARYTTTADGRTYLSQILISGMSGSIVVDGRKLSGLMPSFASKLTDGDIAAVLGYVLASFNHVTATIVTPADVAGARTRNPGPSDTNHLRTALLATP